MKYGDLLSFEVTDLDRKGRGCGKIGERNVCAYFTVPGEEVEGTFVSRKKGVRLIRLGDIKRPSPHRIAPRCEYAGKCGGCTLQHIDYGHQLELKRKRVNRSFAEAGVSHEFAEVVPCPERFYYRNRMDYCFGPKGQLGLKEPGRWNSHVDLATCYLLSPDAVKVMTVVRDHMTLHGLEPWDNYRHRGFLRYLVIREGKNTGERMATLVTAPGALPGRADLIGNLKPLVTTLYHGINPEITDVSNVKEMELLHGPPLMTERIAGKDLFVHPNSFFQTNTVMTEEMVRHVRDFIGRRPSDVLLDLYCGVGLLGICSADLTGRLLGVETDPEAIEMARKNAKRNGIDEASFVAARAERLDWQDERPDTVIVDPPRPGLHQDVTETLMRILPERIVYVSCNHESFIRDWTSMRGKYRLAESVALDLFPHSPHVELVSLLERR